MAKLDELLESARRADRFDRISWRDPIAEYGTRAIPAMVSWVDDPELGAFAVRVLGTIAQRPSDRAAAVAALTAIDPSTTTPAVARDVVSTLEDLGYGRAKGASRGPKKAPADWSGYEAAPALEKRFHDEMLEIFRLAGEATRKRRPDGTIERGYWASYFLRGVRNNGGLPYAHQLLRAKGTTEGFKRLKDENRLDLTMEALVLKPEYSTLFSEEEIEIASSRLASAGYQTPAS